MHTYYDFYEEINFGIIYKYVLTMWKGLLAVGPQGQGLG